MMIVKILFIVIGFILLIKGADFLVTGSSNIAKKFHIPEIIIGLTIVSIGTSMPELFVSLTSALEGRSDMAIGNVIGSNVCNLFLILGLSAFIRSIKFKRETRIIELPMCLFFTLVFWVVCNTGASISKFESILLLVLFGGFISYTIFMGKNGEKFDGVQDNEEKSNNKIEEKNNKLLKNIIFIVIGVIGLKYGGDFVVDNAVFIAQKLNVSDAIIGLTILAIGTSLPELVTSVTAAIKGNSDIAIGNILGSNIFNILLIIGVSSLISPIVFNLKYNLDLLILVIGMVVLALFPFIPPKNEMSKYNGLVYLLMYGGYMLILFMSS